MRNTSDSVLGLRTDATFTRLPTGAGKSYSGETIAPGPSRARATGEGLAQATQAACDTNSDRTWVVSFSSYFP